MKIDMVMLNSIGDLSITGTQLVVSLGLIVLAIGATVAAIKFRLNRNSEQLIQNKHTNNSSTLERKNASVDTKQHRQTFFWGGTATAALVALLVINWTTITTEKSFELGLLDIPADIMLDPPVTVPLPPSPPEPAPPPPPTTIIDITDEVIDPEVQKDQTTDEDTKSKQTTDKPTGPVKVVPKRPTPPPPPPKPSDDDGEPRIFVERMPYPVGCTGQDEVERKACREQEMVQYIYSNIAYPTIAKEVGAEGMAVISFVVDAKGNMIDIEIAKDPGSGLGQEAKRVVEKMGKNMKWNPGQQQGRKVPVKFNVPVKFKLNK